MYLQLIRYRRVESLPEECCGSYIERTADLEETEREKQVDQLQVFLLFHFLTENAFFADQLQPQNISSNPTGDMVPSSTSVWTMLPNLHWNSFVLSAFSCITFQEANSQQIYKTGALYGVPSATFLSASFGCFGSVNSEFLC